TACSMRPTWASEMVPRTGMFLPRVFMASTLPACSGNANEGIPETTTKGTPSRCSVQRPREGPACQPARGVGILVHQLGQGGRDLLEDFPILLGAQLGRNADRRD